MTGRPNLYLPYLAVLEDWEIYSPATILRKGIDCGLFSFYIKLTECNEETAKRRIRHTLSRLKHNHELPREGDGSLTHQIEGRMPGFGWYGYRWKTAAGLISETPKKNVDCVAPIFGEICKNEFPEILLGRNGLFHLADVARVLGVNANNLIIAAKVLTKGNLRPWTRMGLLPAINGRWLVMMPVFSRFIATCQEKYKNPSKCSYWQYLKVCGVLPIEKLRLDKFTLQKIRQMKMADKKALGIWKSPFTNDLVALDGLLKRMAE